MTRSYEWRLLGACVLVLANACGDSGSEPHSNGPSKTAGGGGGKVSSTAGSGGAERRADGGRAASGQVGGPAMMRPAPMVEQPVQIGCIDDVSAGHHVYTCDNLSHDVEVPQKCLETQCGLVVDMHGGTMTAKQENDGTDMRELGEQFGYIVLQPNAPRGWVDPSVDAPTLATMELLIKVFHLDENRVHMTGFSMGGYMTWRFICDHTDILASAAPMSAATGGNPQEPPGCPFSETKKPTVEIPVLQLQGTMEPLIPRMAGEAQRDAVVTAWQMAPGEQVAGDATYRRIRYQNANQTVYEFIEHDYSSEAPFAGGIIGGHCFPGSPAQYDPAQPPGETKFGCQGSSSFHWGTEVMQFFIAHPKR